MENQNDIASASTIQVVRQVMNYWADRNKAVTDYFNKYADDFYYQEVAPNRSRAIYLFGHLIAINDAMIPLLGLGEKLLPEYAAMFIVAPDKSIAELPSMPELKKSWEKINHTLTQYFNNMSPGEWLDRHMSISPEDFRRDPLRNKLNVLINRTNHQSYHLGQLVLLKPELS
jgi:hypothetical protein